MPPRRTRRSNWHARGGSLPSLVLLGLISCQSTQDPPQTIDQASTPPTADSLRLELALRIPGEAYNGELGFRFGPPCDVDGDGIVDIAAGARFTALEFSEMGTVTAWSSRDGSEIRHWEGHGHDALFGHSVLAGPDADGDGVADLIATAPNGKYHGTYRGIVYARSAVTGRLLWSMVGEPDAGLGWDMALAGDQNADGTTDLFIGAPRGEAIGIAYLVDGRSGRILRTFSSGVVRDQFAWHVAAVPDIDGDHLDDLLVGAFGTQGGDEGDADRTETGAVFAFSSASGERLREWKGHQAGSLFGEIVAGVQDIDGDGFGDVVVGAAHRPSLTRDALDDAPRGEVYVYSGATGNELYHWTGTQRGELYGRAVAGCSDLNGDDVAEIAIGAPWHRSAGGDRAGRFEVRSGKSGELLFERQGARSEMWLGWHIEPAANLSEDAESQGLLVSALRSEESGRAGAGALHLYVVRGRD